MMSLSFLQAPIVAQPETCWCVSPHHQIFSISTLDANNPKRLLKKGRVKKSIRLWLLEEYPLIFINHGLLIRGWHSMYIFVFIYTNTCMFMFLCGSQMMPTWIPTLSTQKNAGFQPFGGHSWWWSRSIASWKPRNLILKPPQRNLRGFADWIPLGSCQVSGKPNPVRWSDNAWALVKVENYIKWPEKWEQYGTMTLQNFKTGFSSASWLFLWSISRRQAKSWSFSPTTKVYIWGFPIHRGTPSHHPF